MRQLRVGSLFSGCGGADHGLEQAGMKTLWLCEIDKNARRVLARHWPEVPCYGDAATLDTGTLAPVDVLTAGWPCQDNSVAGRRAGLAGSRSGLFREVVRVARDIRPRWLVLENVPGLLSVNGGRDMGAVLWALGQLGYWWAYRSLDIQYLGVAQRRLRVFFVCHLGEPTYPAKILFEPESCQGNPPPSRASRERPAASLTSGSHGTGVNAPGRRHEDDANLVTIASGQTARYGKGTDSDAGDPLVFDWQAGASAADTSFRGKSRKYIVRTDGHAGAVSTSRVDAIAYQCQGTNVGEMGELRRGNGHLTGGVPFTFNWQTGGSKARLGCPAEACDSIHVGQTPAIAHALSAEGADASEDGTGRGTPIIAFDTTQITHPANHSHPRAGDPCHPLAAGAHPPTITGMAVRRLTPRECERLQGLPDDWTRWDAEGNELSDAARYRMVGNIGGVPAVTWIGRRIVELEAGE